METDLHRNKIEAIYDLREAAEIKATAEQKLAAEGTEAARDALLTAQLDVEAKTQDAIEVSNDCGDTPPAERQHHSRGRVTNRHANVIGFDFGYPEGA